MFDKEKFIYSNFVKNIATLATGTIISQLILILSSPLLSRIYVVDSFGKLAIFTSITSFFAVFSTGRYELAIGLPDKDKDSLSIIKLIFFIGLIISSFYFILVFFLKEILKYDDGFGFLNQNEALIAPIYIFIIAIHSALTYWNQRKKKYKIIAVSNAIQIITSTLCGVVLGFCFNLQSGMIYSMIIGISCSCFFYILTDKNLLQKVFYQNTILIQLKDYLDFPKFSTLTDLSLVASQQFIPLVFSFFYSTTVVGLFSFANRIIRIPSIVITSAIANVFRNEAIDAIRENYNCEKLYLSTLKKLIVISFPIYLTSFLFSPYFFSYVFGSLWSNAGIFAQIISVFLFFEFVATPLNTLFSIRGKQKLLMGYQFFGAISGMISLYIGFVLYENEYISLVLFTINSCLLNIVLIYQSHKISKIFIKPL